MGVAEYFSGFGVFRHLDDAIADRLLFISLIFEEQAVVDVGLGRRRRLHNLDPRRPFHGAEILGGLFDFVVGHPFGDVNHGIGVGLAGIGALAITVPKFVHLLDEVGDGETGHTGVFGAAFAIRVVAERTGAHVWLFAMGHDIGHRRMVSRKTVR